MSKWWNDYDWRFIQTNLREIDMKDINAKRYVADLKSFNATVTMINTSGIIASYETKLPYHYQSPFLTGDSLQEIITECHNEGIKVMARTDFSKVRRPIYEAHPDWAFVDVNGNIVDYQGDIHVCINSDYQQKYALEIIRETWVGTSHTIIALYIMVFANVKVARNVSMRCIIYPFPKKRK